MSLEMLGSFITGAGMEFPVVMRCPYEDYEKLKLTVEIATGVATLKIGGLALIDDAKQLIACTGDDTVGVVIILDTEHNKAIMRQGAAASTPITKELHFAAADYIDVLPMIPGTILSVKMDDSHNAPYGTHLKTFGTDGLVGDLLASATDEPAADIGKLLCEFDAVATDSFVPMLVG